MEPCDWRNGPLASEDYFQTYKTTQKVEKIHPNDTKKLRQCSKSQNTSDHLF